MHDSSKRNTLKVIGGSTAGAVIPTSLVMAEAATRPGAELFPVAATRKPDISIQLVHSTAVVEDTILITNNTDERIVVSQFTPGNVIFDDMQCNLNAAAGDREIVLEPQQIVSLTTRINPAESDSIMEYVWADKTERVVSDTLSLVDMGAFMVDKRAVVYPDYLPTAQSVFPV